MVSEYELLTKQILQMVTLGVNLLPPIVLFFALKPWRDDGKTKRGQYALRSFGFYLAGNFIIIGINSMLGSPINGDAAMGSMFVMALGFLFILIGNLIFFFGSWH